MSVPIQKFILINDIRNANLKMPDNVYVKAIHQTDFIKLPQT